MKKAIGVRVRKTEKRDILKISAVLSYEDALTRPNRRLERL